jgi:SpoVK/Ycf46/Vps4 family AAA+-type ATPase
MTKNATHKFASSIEHLENLVAARVPLIWVVTSEETRFLQEFSKNKKIQTNKKTWYWSATSGIVPSFEESNMGVACSGEFDGTKTVTNALDKFFDYDINAHNKTRLIIVMKDIHIALQDIVARKIRDIYYEAADSGKTIVIVSPFLAYAGGSGLHPLLEKQVVVVDYKLPNLEEITTVAKHTLDAAFLQRENSKPIYSNDEWKLIGRSLQGLTSYEIENALATSITAFKTLDAEVLMKEKKQLIRKSNILEYIDSNVNIDDVGGLDLVKEYLTRYANITSEEAEKFGVEPLKGIVITGIPGVGKSLIAKAISHLWKLPLLKLDIGKIFGRLVGDSEANMRSAIAVIESASPNLVWIDEIEKALSGTGSSNMTDGGTTSRVFGTLLTAMQEGMKGCTIIATANDISKLPPELLRRFNEIFFVDLPSDEERWEIFGIHLTKRRREMKNFIGAKRELLEASEGFTGAEIEKAIQDAIALAFYNKQKDIQPKNILQTLKETKPISRVQSEQIVALQKWAVNHARFASSASRDKHQKIKDSTKIETLDMSDISKDLGEIQTKEEKKKAKIEQKAVGRFENLSND